MWLEKHRKGWWGDLVYPFVAADLKGVGMEYLEHEGRNGGGRTR